MSIKILPCTIMRGGTSKGVFFARHDLPDCEEDMKFMILEAFGKGTHRGVDGLGGLDPLANKIAVISPSTLEGIDVDYLFMQIADLEQGVIDTSINCGNILTAVVPYALEKQLVSAQGTKATVRIRNLNTKTVVHASMPVKDGQPMYLGDQQILGVPGGGAPIELNFMQAIGCKTGKPFPSGHHRDEIDGLPYTFIDGAVPLIIIGAVDLDKTGYETQGELNSDKEFLTLINNLRQRVSLSCGLGDVCQKVYPKVAIISEARNGGDINSRYFVPYTCHAAYAVTGGLTLGVAARIEGTIVHEMIKRRPPPRATDEFRIEHPSGHMDIYVIPNLID